MFRRFTGTLALLLASTLNAQNKTPTAPQKFHGTYQEDLLVIDWWVATVAVSSLLSRKLRTSGGIAAASIADRG